MSHNAFRACIAACYDSAGACDHCATSCLSEPPEQGLVECMRLALECASLCRLAAATMQRVSALAPDLCADCAAMCARCADACGRHELDHCRACAVACLRCADECLRIGAPAQPLRPMTAPSGGAAATQVMATRL